MALLAETNINDLIEARRIDAEFFKYQNIVNAVERLNPTEIVEYSSWITQGPNPKFSNEGYDCLTGRNIADGNLTYEGSDKVDEEEFNAYKRFHLQENDILITLKGAGSTGKVGIYRKEKPAMFSRNLGVIRIKKETFHPFYFYAFLNSQHGQKLIDRLVTGGTGQLTLATSALKRLKIPIFERSIQGITNKVTRHFELQEKSKSLYTQAEQLLLKELGLEDFTPEWVAGYETDYDNVLEVARMDAEYFQPRYKLLMDRIYNAKQNEELGKISSLSKKKVDIQTEETYKYIEIGDVNTSNGEFSYNEVVGSDLPANAKKSIQDENLLISTVRPTRGAVGVIPNVWNDGFVVSGAFAVFEKHSISPFYLQVVMRSVIGKMQLERRCTGVSYPTVTDEDVANVLIPLLDDEKIEKIHDLVMESHKSLHESRQLLEQAKREVEEMIESKTS